MPVVEELIRTEKDGHISFGNYSLDKKTKLDQFEYHGDLYKVKTCREITKLERNGMFVYESVPGTAVEHLNISDDRITFSVEGEKDAQLTLQLEEDTCYMVSIDGESAGEMKTNRSGKFSVSVELNEGVSADIQIVKQR